MASPTVLPHPPDTGGLRRALLAVSVLDDVDVLPCDDGVLLEVPGPTEAPRRVHLGWAAVAAVAGPWSAGSAQARLRLSSWLRSHLAVAGARDPAALVSACARALALPVAGGLHPGAGSGWARVRVLGGALEVGLGVVGLESTTRDATTAASAAPGAPRPQPAAIPLWPDVAAAAGLDDGALDAVWAGAAERALRMGALSAVRLRRDHEEGQRAGEALRLVLRPVGGCDVLTLLATGPVRAALAAVDGVGMAHVAVPDRTRGWCDSRRAQPDFLAAAWSATSPMDRGVPGLLLVTADEVMHASTVSRC